MWLVLRDGKPICARASEIEAKCYASGFSKQEGVEIIDGNFIPNVEVWDGDPKTPPRQ